LCCDLQARNAKPRDSTVTDLSLFIGVAGTWGRKSQDSLGIKSENGNYMEQHLKEANILFPGNYSHEIEVSEQ
jgi:hypothetical protein